MQTPLTNVQDGSRAGSGTETILVPKSGKQIRILGYRLQVHTVTVAGVVELVGRNGTKVSGEVYVDSNGLQYVQDTIRVSMAVDEVLRLRNTTDGTVVWSVNVEDFASVDKDFS